MGRRRFGPRSPKNASWRSTRLQGAALPGIVIDAPPDLSLFAFHLRGPEPPARKKTPRPRLDGPDHRRGRVMLTGCTAHGRFLGRVCVLSFRTHQAEIDALIEDMAAAIQEIRSQHD
jgi:aromatic-L-amino-acid decarboxylase